MRNTLLGCVTSQCGSGSATADQLFAASSSAVGMRSGLPGSRITCLISCGVPSGPYDSPRIERFVLTMPLA
jgi:hypothetical protein